MLGVKYEGYPPDGGSDPFWMRAHARNQRIVDKVDVLVALFSSSQRSPGTSDTIRRAKAKGSPVWVWQEGVWAAEP